MVHFAEINQAPPLYSILQYIGRVATSKLVPRNCLRYLETKLIIGGEGLVSEFTWGILAFCETINVIRTKISRGIGEFSQKTQSCPFWLKIGTHNLLEALILYFHLDFWNSDPKIHFWANLGRKNQSCSFCLKIATHGILRILILIPTLVFWISNPKSIFGQIWTKRVKVVCFAWKLAQMVSQGCWFLFQH